MSAAGVRRDRARTSRIVALATVLVAAAALVVALRLGDGDRARYVAAVDMLGNPVVPDADARVTTAQAAAMRIAPTGLRLQVPSVGLDVPVDALTAIDGTVTPPGFAEAYWVRNVGVAPADAATGTVFLVAHSTRGGAVAPGNYLIDIPGQRSAVADGAVIDLGGLRYRVTGSRVLAKTDIAGEASVWQDVPGRLQIVTCLQRSTEAGVPSVSNLVITAQMDSTPTVNASSPEARS